MAANRSLGPPPPPFFFPGGVLPLRVEVEVDDKHYKDSFLWNSSEPEFSLHDVIKEAVLESGFPLSFVSPALHQAQTQLSELRGLQVQLGDYVRDAQQDPSSSHLLFRASTQNWNEDSLQLMVLDVKVNSTVLSDRFYWDVNNPHSDPDAFARELCQDLDISDPEVAPAISIAVREQLVEAAKQLVGWRENRYKKGRRGERQTASEAVVRPMRGVSLLTLLERFHSSHIADLTVLRPRELWSVFGPTLETVTEENLTEAVDNRELKRLRFKRRVDS